MKKLQSLYLGASFLILQSGASLALEQGNDKMETTLSSLYGAPVVLEISGPVCKLQYPQTTIEEEIKQYIEPKKPDEQPQVETKIQKTVIPETNISCKKTDDFYGKEQYAASHNSADKFRAQIYNLTGLSFIKDVEFKQVAEEFSMVPELGVISSEKIHIENASYTEKDKTTGLKSEIGSLQDFTLEHGLKRDGNQIKHSTNMVIDGLNLALPFFSLQVASERQAAEITYNVPQDGNFDYAQIWRNLEHLAASKSRAVGKGIKLDIAFFDTGISFDLDTKNYAELKKSGNIDSTGNLLMNNVLFSGNMISESKRFQSVEMKYSLNGLQTKNLAKLSAIQDARLEKQEKSEEDDKELAELFDSILETASMDMEMKFKFKNAEIALNSDFQRKNNYLTGEVKVAVTNLYNIFPDQKQCVNNPQAGEIKACMADFLYSSLKEYIDVSKDDSVTTFKYNEQGVFRGNEKIGEPVELNFQKMLQEQREKEQHLQEQKQKMNEEIAKIEKEIASDAPSAQ